MKTTTNYEPPFLLKNLAPIEGEKTILVDNDVLWRTCNDDTGANIERIRAYIRDREFSPRTDLMFGATPLTVMEALGIIAPQCPLQADQPITPILDDCFASLLEKASGWFLACPELQEQNLRSRGDELRKEVRNVNALSLFDATIMRECHSGTLSRRLADALAWHLALDPHRYPLDVRPHISEYILNLSLSGEVWPFLSRFRRVKEFWDGIYRLKRNFSEESAIPFESINRAMRLKANRDYLDCDLIHAACFGYFEDRDLVIITEDDPHHMRWRASCYRSFITYVAKRQGVAPQRGVRANSIMVVDERGQIRQEVFPQSAPTVVFLGSGDDRPTGVPIAGRINKARRRGGSPSPADA